MGLALVAMALGGCTDNGERTTPGVQPAVVPAVIGLPAERAVRAIENAGLRASLVNPSLAPVPVESCGSAPVTAQSDEPGAELVRGSTIDLTVSCTEGAGPLTTPTP